MTRLATLSDCLPGSTEDARARLDAFESWLEARSASVNVLAVGEQRSCRIAAHALAFEATEPGSGFSATWRAILAAVAACEGYEAGRFQHHCGLNCVSWQPQPVDSDDKNAQPAAPAAPPA